MAEHTLVTLIKLAGQKVERVQQELAAAQRLMGEVHATQKKWLDDEARGDQTALNEVQAGNADGLKFAGAFATRVHNELAKLAQVETVLKTQVAGIMARLNAHYAEQKRYEILHEQHLLAEHKKHAKKVQAQLDESAQVKVRKD